MEERSSRWRVAIVGAGRLGTVLGIALHAAGYTVTACASRGEASAARLAGHIPGCLAAPSAHAAAERAEIVFLTVPDDSIEAVVSQVPWQLRHVAVHCSGALPASILAAAAAAGARAAGFHPLQSFADLEGGLQSLRGATIGIEADDATWGTLAEMAEAIGGVPLRLGEADRALYHAASVFASNFTVGLAALAADLWKPLGVERDEAVRALLPLIEGTVHNLHRLGVPAALTGPVARGDIGTVVAHIAALSRFPNALAVYTAISERLIDLAVEGGTMSDERAAALRSALTRG